MSHSIKNHNSPANNTNHTGNNLKNLHINSEGGKNHVAGKKEDLD